MDIGRDPEAPMELFSGHLEPDECTQGPLTLYSDDGHMDTPGGNAPMAVHGGRRLR